LSARGIETKEQIKKVVLLVITKFKDEITKLNTSNPHHLHHSNVCGMPELKKG